MHAQDQQKQELQIGFMRRNVLPFFDVYLSEITLRKIHLIMESTYVVSMIPLIFVFTY